jgi:hypothetical protein
VELLGVGLVGLVLGCVLGAGATAVVAHFVNDRHGGYSERFPGWHDRGPRGQAPQGPFRPDLPKRPAQPTPAPSAS